MFCSADIVGSTAYKSGNSIKSGSSWAATFSEFFRSFPEELQNSYAKLPAKYEDSTNQLTPWKFSGDEILFSVPISRHQEGISHLWAFKDAVKRFPEENWQKKDLPLGLKATGWIAGFPVTNRKVRIQQSNTVDYLGPAIDLGFRVSKFATTTKFVLSADLALLILHGYETCEPASSDMLKLFLDSKQALKGVINGVPYPIIYCDMNDGISTEEEILLGLVPIDNPDLLKKYLRTFLESTPNLIKPFIKNDENPKYGTLPDEIVNLREQMMAEESDRNYLNQSHLPEPQVEGAARQPNQPSIEPPDTN